MACTCQHETPPATQSPRYRRILWAALLLNATMFVVELAGSQRAGSLSLLADAIDFAGDALNYGVSLAVLAPALAWRARAAWVKAWSMMGFGAFVLGGRCGRCGTARCPSRSPWAGGVAGAGGEPGGGLAALRLPRGRRQHAQRVAVLAQRRHRQRGGDGAALGVAGTGTAWPDLAVAALMATLALQGGLAVRRQARDELGHRPRAHQVVRSETTGTSGSEK
jgi:hypothetical protein